MTERQAALTLLRRLMEMTGYPETPEQEQEQELKEISALLGFKLTSFRQKAMQELMQQLNKVHAAFLKKGA